MLRVSSTAGLAVPAAVAGCAIGAEGEGGAGDAEGAGGAAGAGRAGAAAAVVATLPGARAREAVGAPGASRSAQPVSRHARHAARWVMRRLSMRLPDRTRVCNPHALSGDVREVGSACKCTPLGLRGRVETPTPWVISPTHCRSGLGAEPARAASGRAPGPVRSQARPPAVPSARSDARAGLGVERGREERQRPPQPRPHTPVTSLPDHLAVRANRRADAKASSRRASNAHRSNP